MTGLYACDPTGTRQPIVEFTTVDLGDITVAQFGLDEHRHTIRVASTDPAWPLLAAHLGVDMSVGVGWLASRVEWQLWNDGELVADGLSDGPIEPADGSIDLRVAGGGQILRDRTLGYDEDPDVWGGAGKWPTTSLPSGWTATAWDWNTTDPLNGVRSLRLNNAPSVLTSPTLNLVAFTGWSRTYEMRAIVRTPGQVLARFQTRTLVGSTWSPWEIEEVRTGAAGMPVNEWQEVRVAKTIGSSDTGSTTQYLGAIWATKGSEVGQVTLHRDQPMFTADRRTPESAITTLLNVGQNASVGGTLGITRVAGEPSGIEEHYAWDRLDNPSLPQALKAVADTPGGPEIWFEPGRRLHHSKRAGTDRDDIALTLDTVIDATVETDTAQRWHSVRAATGWAAGPAEPVIRVDSTPPPGVIRRQTVTTVPANLGYRAARDVARRQADHLSLPPYTVHATVTPAIAAQVNLGDCIRTILDVDGWSIDEWLRVGRIIWHPQSDTYTVELGTDMLTSGLGTP